MKKVVIILVLLPLLSFQTVGKLVKTKFSEEISGLVPEQFFMMTPEDILRRLPSARTPLVAYTDEARNIDFSINMSATSWAQKDIVMAKDFYKSNIFHLFDEVKMLNEGLKIINGREFAIFEFESFVKGDGLSKKSIRKYTYIQYTIKNNKAYVVSFNSPVQLREKWASSVKEMMDNIKIK